MHTNYDDREKCHFYYKIGVCRHGNKCSKKHIPPVRSKSMEILNLVDFPVDGSPMSTKDFDAIYEDLYIELCKYGKIQNLFISENGNDHLRGNVCVMFEKEQSAQDARDNLNTRWFNGKPIYCDLTHICDFNEAICRKHYDAEGCDRGDECNFMHIKLPTLSLKTELEKAQAKKYLMESH